MAIPNKLLKPWVLNLAARRFASASAKPGGHSHHNSLLWKRISLFGAIPACILCAINTYMMEKEHEAHFERQPFIPYEYMRIRTKKFPWGDGNHTLFHNPKVNPLPDGYEDENLGWHLSDK